MKKWVLAYTVSVTIALIAVLRPTSAVNASRIPFSAAAPLQDATYKAYQTLYDLGYELQSELFAGYFFGEDKRLHIDFAVSESIVKGSAFEPLLRNRNVVCSFDAPYTRKQIHEVLQNAKKANGQGDVITSRIERIDESWRVIVSILDFNAKKMTDFKQLFIDHPLLAFENVSKAHAENGLLADSPPVCTVRNPRVFMEASTASGRYEQEPESGQMVRVISEQKGWKGVLFLDGKDGSNNWGGYMQNRDLILPKSQKRFALNNLNIRSYPSTKDNQNIIGLLRLGEGADIKRITGKWAEIEHQGKPAYVWSRLLTKNRYDCYWNSDFAKVMGKSNIRGIRYDYEPYFPIECEIRPLYNVTYDIKSTIPLTCSVFQFASEYDALLARQAIQNTQLVPDWPHIFYQRGNQVVVATLSFFYEGSAYKDAKTNLENRTLQTLYAYYGEPIGLKVGE